jgi:hypothetical protein
VGLEQEDFQTVLRAARETETTQGDIQNWLQLAESDLVFQLLTDEYISAVIFYFFSSALPILLKFPFIYFPGFCCILGLSFVSFVWIIT